MTSIKFYKGAGSSTVHVTIATDALTMAVKRMSRAGNCYDNAMMESL
jgi:transposase InsO family protein